MEAAESATRDVLEEDALDGLLRAEVEDLPKRGFHHLHASIIPPIRVAPDADPRESGARGVRGSVPPSGRSAAGEVHRRDVSRQRRTAQLRTRDARLYRRVRG